MATVMDHWLRTGKPVIIGDLPLRPLENPALPGVAVYAERGQARAFPVRGEQDSTWILKKFLAGRCPGEAFLRDIARVLPAHPAMRAGTERRVLSATDLQKRRGHHAAAELARWLEGVVLMPCALGVDWAAVADEIRAGKLSPSLETRLALAADLAGAVQTLEAFGCAHRDLSAGNVFVDVPGVQVALIDFDGIYHAQLATPEATTAGTDGYMPGFLWRGDTPDVGLTRCVGADRFALAVLIVELVIVNRRATLTGDGGLFDQADLRTGRGKTIKHAVRQLHATCPPLVPLFETALQARSFTQCPEPQAWITACQGGRNFKLPNLNHLDGASPQDFAAIIAKVGCSTRSQAVKAPSLPGISVFSVPKLPADPWAA